MKIEPIGHLLLSNGCIDQEQLDFALGVQKSNGQARLGQVLKHYNFISDLDIAQALAHQVGWGIFQGEYVPELRNLEILGKDFCLSQGVFPLKSDGLNMFVLTSVHDTAVTDYIEKKINEPNSYLIGIEHELHNALAACCVRPLQQTVNTLDARESLLPWFDELVQKAISESATDIHIEPSSKAVEIRFRVDGILYFIDSIHLKFLPRVVNVIFNKADVNISDFYHVHDARFSYCTANREIDIRVSHIPTIFGSSVVMRILDKGKMAMGLVDLGYSPQHWKSIEENLIRPDGITLIVGPTGCGKTTSLYAMLNHLKSISKKIVTVEDPVEVKLPLVTQLQINEERGITFGESVRAFLRHDPDIMLVGEIRDEQTAREAVRASLTGHKVFATLHATRAHDALLRLKDLGIEDYYISDCLTMVMAQRLVRKLCTHCRVSKRIQRADIKPYLQKYIICDEQVIYEPRGCPLCTFGYQGRIVVAEVIVMDEKSRNAFTRCEKVMPAISFLEDGQRIIQEGVTGLDEMVRVLG